MCVYLDANEAFRRAGGGAGASPTSSIVRHLSTRKENMQRMAGSSQTASTSAQVQCSFIPLPAPSITLACGMISEI